MATKRTVAVNRAGRRVAIGLRALLIGVFFFGSLPQVFDPLGDYSPLKESRLVSTKEFIETGALRRGFKSDRSQGQESFLATGVLYHVQVQRASILDVNRKPASMSQLLLALFLSVLLLRSATLNFQVPPKN